MQLDDGSAVTAERLRVATGCGTKLAALGVGAVGLDEDARTIEVDEHTRADGVWAIGDVTGKGAVTPISVYQARIAAPDILGNDRETAEYHAVPRATFTDPEVGVAGLTEGAARDRGLSVHAGLARIPSSARDWIHKAGNAGLVTLVENADRVEVCGGRRRRCRAR